MGDVASQEGRTVLFVSHNMAAVSNLCPKSILLAKGKLIALNNSDLLIAEYQKNCQVNQKVSNLSEFRPSWAKPIINNVKVKDETGRETSVFQMGEKIVIEMEYASYQIVQNPVMGIVISHKLKGVVGGVNTRMTGHSFRSTKRKGKFQCQFLAPLLPGNYSIDVWLGDGQEDVDTLSGVISFVIEPSDIYKSGKTPFSHMGVIYLVPEWGLECFD